MLIVIDFLSKNDVRIIKIKKNEFTIFKQTTPPIKILYFDYKILFVCLQKKIKIKDSYQNISQQSVNLVWNWEDFSNSPPSRSFFRLNKA